MLQRSRKPRKKALEYHPEKSWNKAAEEKFKEAAEAYEILNANKKTNTINMVIKPLMVRWFCGGGHGGMNMDDIFSQFGDIFGSAFGGGGGFGGGEASVELKEVTVSK
jgi:molecular chaperone DnaJ